MRSTRRTVAVVLTHVLLAALALGAVAVFGAGADPQRAHLWVTVPDLDPRLPVNPDTLVVVRPPGTLALDSTREKHGATLDAVLPKPEAKVLADAGAVHVKARVARDGDSSRGVWQIAIRDGVDPRDALRDIDQLYADDGWQRVRSGTPGLLVRKQTPSKAQPLAANRAHYVYGPYLIRIEAYGLDQERVDREFAALARAQLDERSPG